MIPINIVNLVIELNLTPLALLPFGIKLIEHHKEDNCIGHGFSDSVLQ